MKYTDELLYMRELARAAKQWDVADQMRVELLSRKVIVTDTKDGQEAIHLPDGWTVDAYLKKRDMDRKAEAMFDAWLFTQRERIANAKRLLST